MAVRGAHLTATEREKPSIFEVIAADSLQATFHPAIKRLCAVLTESNPTWFGWTMQYYDELFLLLNAAVQQYYVRNMGASLAEVFYGLTRQSTRQLPHQPLGQRSCWLLFCSVVFVPYLRQKVESLLQRYRRDLDERVVPDSTLRQRQLQRLALRLFTGASSAYEFAQVLQYVAYMAGRADAHSVALRLLGQYLRYAGDDERKAAVVVWSDVWRAPGRVRPAALLTSVMFRGLELSAFFLQFVRWWTDEASNTSLMRLPVPEAPPGTDSNEAKFMGICPICVQSWDIPTAVRVSGYVYCYKCIMRHFDTVAKTCPVSKYPADVDDLIHVIND